MTYDEQTCYWCGKRFEEGEKATFSLKTDTVKYTRNFCDDKCLNAFKEKADYRNDSTLGWYFLPPYGGKRKE